MAIRVIQEVKIECDGCGRGVAKLRASRQVVEALSVDSGNGQPEGERFATITCWDCVAAEAKKESEPKKP